MTALKRGTLVVVAGRFGTVIGEARRGPAKGYSVATVPEHSPDGTFPHFVEAYMVHSAEIGVNVCAKRRGQCFCGFVHIDHPEWLTPRSPTGERPLLKRGQSAGSSPVEGTETVRVLGEVL